MQLSVIGTGYVGLMAAACFADIGHDVIGVDRDAGRIELLRAGRSPIYEPGLEDVLRRVEQTGRLRFTTATAEAVRRSEVIFITVGTPPPRGRRGRHDGRGGRGGVDRLGAGDYRWSTDSRINHQSFRDNHPL